MINAAQPVRQNNARYDLDSPEHIKEFIDAFYSRLLADDVMRPLFIDVAGIDLKEHLPTIVDYWCKMLLGKPCYRNHMMKKHRAVHGKRPFETRHFHHWLHHFEATLDYHCEGPYSHRARRLARSVINNMHKQVVGVSFFNAIKGAL